MCYLLPVGFDHGMLSAIHFVDRNIVHAAAAAAACTITDVAS